MTIHVVQPGETVFGIAALYGVSPQRLIWNNEILNPEQLVPGQALLILFPSQIYQVQPGDTLFGIATSYETTVMELLQQNPDLVFSSQLTPGQEIIISYTQPKLRQVTVNGYAYPYINRQTLTRTLPYMTFLSIFSYGFTPQGQLVPTDDRELIAEGKRLGSGPVMVLTPTDASGSFSNYLASQVINNPAAQNTLISNVLSTLRSKGYYGVDIDFEFVLPEDRDAFAAFIGNFRDRLNPEGFSVFAALAPKISADQPGLLYEAHDYRAVGQNANLVLLMTYEWGYTYGPPMAVAPINKVREVLDYAVTEISPDKISMGIPNYGYDWTLPFIQGESRARSIGNVEAIQIASRYNASIQYDLTAQAPYFEYKDETGADHIVWFEDVRSMNAKALLIPEYGFQGMGYWNIMRDFRQNWLLISTLFDIHKYPRFAYST